MVQDANSFEMIMTAHTPARPTFVSMIRHGRVCSTIPGVIEPPEIAALVMPTDDMGAGELDAMLRGLLSQRVRVTFEIVEGVGWQR